MEVLDELRILVMTYEVVLRARDEAEQVNETLCYFSDVVRNCLTARGGSEDGEVDVRIRAGRVEEAAKCDCVWQFPQFEDAVYVGEVVEEASVLVPALSGDNSLEQTH